MRLCSWLGLLSTTSTAQAQAQVKGAFSIMDYSQINCTDHVTSLRYLVTSNGSRQYRYQCIKCGDTIGKGAIKYSDLTDEQRAHSIPYDQKLQEEYRRSKSRIRQAAFEAERTERSIEWWKQYNEYLQSPGWKDKQRRVLDRDNKRCTARLPGCEAIAVQAHHLNYDHVFNEPLFDLTSVCIHCHDEITRMDREKRKS